MTLDQNGLKLNFEWNIEFKDEHSQGIFYKNQGTFFLIFKIGQGRSPP